MKEYKRLETLEDIEKICAIVCKAMLFDSHMIAYRVLPSNSKTPAARYHWREVEGRLGITFYSDFFTLESAKTQRKIIIHEHCHHLTRYIDRCLHVLAEDASKPEVYGLLAEQYTEQTTVELERIFSALLEEQL